MLGLLILGLFIANIIVVFTVVQIKIKKLKSSQSQLPEVREEIDKFMAALDENVGGYVALMEQLRSDADKVMEKVDRKLRLLEKESTKMESARQLYNDLAKQGVAESIVASAEPRATYSSLGKQKSLVQAVVHVQSSTGKTIKEPKPEVLHQTSPIEVKYATTEDDSLFGQEIVERSSKVLAKTPVQQVAALWREGKNEKEIAGELGLSLGEVELALELTGARR